MCLDIHYFCENAFGGAPQVLWRQKEQFSDGVGYGWIDGLKAHAAKVITDQELASAAIRFPYNTPSTKEGLYIRQIFQGHFPNNQYGNGVETTVRFRPLLPIGLESPVAERLREPSCMRTLRFLHPYDASCRADFVQVPGGPSVACSTAKAIEWDASWSDPTKQDQSGRFVDTHETAVVN